MNNKFQNNSDRPDKVDDLQRSTVTLTLDIFGYLGCIALIIYVASRWSTGFFDPYWQNDDVRALISHFWAFHENELFKGDYISRAMNAYTSLFYKLIYYLFTFGFDLLTVTKIIQILVIAWSGFHVFNMGHRRAGGMGGLFALYLLLHTYTILERSAGGLPRAFGFPVILMTVDGIDRKSERQSGLAAILGFGIYPPAGLIALATHTVWRFTQLVINKGNWLFLRRGIINIVVVVSLCFLFITPTLLKNSEFGKIVTLSQARLMPELGQSGRFYLIPLPKAADHIAKNFGLLSKTSGDSPTSTLENFTNETSGAPLYIFMVLALIFAVIGLIRPPVISLYVASVSIILFYLSILFAFNLYHPERIITYSLPVVVLYLVVSSFTEVGHKYSKDVVPKISSLIALLIFIGFFGIAFKGPVGLTVKTHLGKELFQLLQTLPKDALLAGHPSRMNDIPLWSKRSVLVSFETSLPWLDITWHEIKGRNYDNFEAYYASSPEPLIVLQEKYGVDYMLIHEFDMSPLYAKSCNYFEPFTTWVKRLCQKPSKDLIWKKAAPHSIVGKASGFTVIDLKTFLASLVHQRPGNDSLKKYEPQTNSIKASVDHQKH